jgi:hypothetical protein
MAVLTTVSSSPVQHKALSTPKPSHLLFIPAPHPHHPVMAEVAGEVVRSFSDVFGIDDTEGHVVRRSRNHQVKSGNVFWRADKLFDRKDSL